jgi:acyl-CoA reductase-like NAD-dependent aldehyde dehydrogenase
VDQANVERVERFVEDAKGYARVLLRGGRITEGPLAKGAFFRPALLEPNSIDTPLVQQEVFAPVLSFETFVDEPAALARANATEFGLAASVFTADRSRAHRVAQGLKAGTVWTNTWGIVDDVFEEGGVQAERYRTGSRPSRRRGISGNQDPDRNGGSPHPVASDRSEGSDNLAATQMAMPTRPPLEQASSHAPPRHR